MAAPFWKWNYTVHDSIDISGNQVFLKYWTMLFFTEYAECAIIKENTPCNFIFQHNRKQLLFVMCDAKNRKVCLVANTYFKPYAPPKRWCFFISKLQGGDAHLNTKSTASCGCGKPRTTPISQEEKRWLREKVCESRYDEFLQARREAWLFLRPGHKKNYQQEGCHL